MTKQIEKPWKFESLGQPINLGLPIFLFIIAIFSFIWFLYEVKKKRIEWKSLISWIIWNSIYMLITLYILIIASIHAAGIKNIPNIFNEIAYYLFGLDFENEKQWIILFILMFIAIILIQTLKNSIKISKLDLRIDELNKQTAILMGQVNRTTDFENLPLAFKQKNSKEIKNELREKLKIEKAKIKIDKKIKLLTKSTYIKK